MTVSLGAIEEALFAALVRINPNAAAGTPGVTPGTPRNINGAVVKYIGRWIGEPIRSTPVPDFYRAAIEREVADRCPSILLGFDGEAIDPRPNALETLSGNVETVGLATWSVLAVLKDSRATRVVMQGTPPGTAPTLGVYDVALLIEEALTNLGITGLYRSTNVRFLDSRPLIISPGELYVLQLRFQTRRVLADVREVGTDPVYNALDNNALLTLAGDVNLYPADLTGDFPPLPLSSILSYPGGAQPLPDYPPLRGLLARFDASAVNGVDRFGAPLPLPNNNQPVAQWRCRHSGRWLLAQADPAIQPTLTLTGIGTQPGVRFADLDTLAGPIDWLPIEAESRTLVVIGAQYGNTGQSRQALAGYGSAAPATGTEVELGLCLGATYRWALDAGGTATVQPFSAPTVDPWLTYATYDGTTALVRSVPVAGYGKLLAVPLALATANARGFSLGGRTIGVLCEVLVYRQALDAAEQTALLDYASARYGINGT